VVFHLFAFFPIVRFDDYQYPDHVTWFHGWKQTAEHAEHLHQKMATKTSMDQTVLFVHNWSLAAQISWYARPTRVQVIEPRRRDQFDRWFGAPEQGTSGILVVPQYLDGNSIDWEIRLALSKFKQTRLLDQLSVNAGGGAMNTFDFYECEKFQ